MTSIGCEEFREMAPDLALGLLAGDERAIALNHLAGCAPCRRHLEGLVQVADDLLLLAPEVEPVIGFESRVMSRLATEGAFAPAPSRPQPVPLRRRRWTGPLIGAVAAALVIVVGVAGVAAGLNRGRSDGRAQALSLEARADNQLAARTVVVWADAGKSTCQLVAFPRQGSQPARLVIHLDEPTVPPDHYQVYAVPDHGGPAVLVGTISVIDGQGTVTVSIPTSAGPVDAVRVTEGPGNTKYWASFAPV